MSNKITNKTDTDLLGFLFGKNGKVTTIYITEQDALFHICHAFTPHRVTHDKGFSAGQGSVGGAGAAIGKDAKALDGNGDPIDTIQLGEGTNTIPRTLQVYDSLLMLPSGMINPEKLPPFPPHNCSRGTYISEYSDLVVNVNREYENYLARPINDSMSFVLPPAEEAEGLPFTFRLFEQSVHEYAMTVERSENNVIMVDGEEWHGITSHDLGFWFTLIAKDGVYYLIKDSGIIEANKIFDD